MGRFAGALVLAGTLGLGPAAAQSVTVSSEVEAGWTSNATDNAAGVGDWYVRHSHDASLTAQTPGLTLRGGIAISQTRFATTGFEDDGAVSGTLEAEWALGDDAVLRLGYGLTQSWLGDDIALPGLTIPIKTLSRRHEYLAEFALAGDDQQVAVTLTGDWSIPGESRLIGFDVPPLRLTPEVGSVVGRVAWERAVSSGMAVLGAMEAWFTLVPEGEQQVYLRAPADGGRIAAGLRLAEGALSAEAWGGVDLVWPKGFSALIEAMPHFALAAGLQAAQGLMLSLSARTDVELAEPLDSVAGRIAQVELGGSWALSEALVLAASLGASVERGLFDDTVGQSVQTARLAATYAASERLSYRLALSWSRHQGVVEGYDKAGVGLALMSNL